MSDARQICRQAAGLVSGDRAAAYGSVQANWQNIADHWNAVLSAKARRDLHPGMPLTPLDCLNMMEALKIARRYSGPHNIDNYIDGAGYAGCAGELAAAAAVGSEALPPQAPATALTGIGSEALSPQSVEELPH